MNIKIKEHIKAYKKGILKGYKITDMGLVPDSWEECALSRFINKLHSGVSLNCESRPAVNDEYGILKTSAVSTDGFKPNENKVVVSGKDLARVEVKKDSLIIVRKNTPELVGQVAYVDCDVKNLFLPDLLWQTEFTSENFKRKWLFYYLNSDYYRSIIKVLATGSSKSMPNISKAEFLKIKVAVPSFDEQKYFVHILSTWDKAIELKEQLIEEKKQQKKGLMKKLLTGEVRLPGFDGEWKVVKVGTILKERCETKHNSLELLAITGKNGIVKRTEVDIKDNSNEDKSKYKRICPLDIGYNTMRMWQGVSGVSEYEGIVSPAYTILAPTKNIDSYFIGYLFKFPKMINIFWRYSQGMVNDTLNLKYSNLKNIKVKIPKEKIEQSEIAKVFMTIDKNIELMEMELSALKLQKKGLMQLLLMGIIRVNS